MRSRLHRVSAAGLLTLIIIFELSAFALLAFRDAALDTSALVFGAVLVVLLLFQYVLLTLFFRNLDRFLLIIANLLVAIGMIIQYRIDPSIAYRQIIWFGIGMLAMVICILLMRRPNIFRRLNWLMMLGGRGNPGGAVCDRLRKIRRKKLDLFGRHELAALGTGQGDHGVRAGALAYQQH